jgi:Ca2+-binding EF-hand superfamily protein
MSENKNYKKFFDIYDTERRNSIKKSELKNILQSIGHIKEFENLFSRYSEEDLISYREFSALMEILISVENDYENSGQYIFNQYAKYGILDSKGLKEILINHTDIMSEEQIEKFVEVISKTEKLIDYELFQKLNIFN